MWIPFSVSLLIQWNNIIYVTVSTVWKDSLDLILVPDSSINLLTRNNGLNLCFVF